MYLLAFHEKPEDRLNALKKSEFVMASGKKRLVRFKKTTVRSISSNEVPCMNDDTYDEMMCRINLVS